MSDIIGSFALKYSFTRYSTPKPVNGQAETKPAATPMTMWATIQTVKGFEAMNLPEGFRNGAAVKVYTQTQLQVNDEQKNLLGDRFNFRGRTYQVMMDGDWTEGTDLPYQKYYATRVENLNNTHA